MSSVWEWLKANKKWLGAGALAVYGYVLANPDLLAWVNSNGVVRHVLGIVGAFLAGGGLLPSDRAIKKFGEDAK